MFNCALALAYALRRSGLVALDGCAGELLDRRRPGGLGERAGDEGSVR
jgi:hypothetical protein